MPSLLLVGGRPIGFTVQVIDIDRRKQVEQALAETENRSKYALESAGLGVWEYDFRRERDFFSATWKTMRGLPGDAEIADGQDEWLARIHPDDRQHVLDEVKEHKAGGAAVRTTEYRERHRDGHWLWIQGRATTVEWLPDGSPARIVGTDTDITDLKNAEEKLQFANMLLNIQMETSRDGILVVDAAARIISYNRRFADMWGVPLELLQANDDAPILAKVTSLVKNPAAFVDRVRYVYEHPEERGHDEVETRDGRWLDRHTGVLHTAAGEYLGRVWFFRDITGRKAAEAQILKAAREDGLTGIANRAVFLEEVHREIVTVRRRAADFAVLYLDLDQFKDVNDTLGHLAGDELLKAVAMRLRANIRGTDIVARFGGEEFAVMMANISGPSDASALADKVIAAIAEPFLILPPSKLELELTETVLMAASRDHNDVLQRLRDRGIRLAIDDFGVGYSSLDYLRRFPVDRIKVAQAFVDSIATEPGGAAIVRAMIGLARELGIDLVAEGVETNDQLELLKAWGCRDAQGFYFAEPLTAEFLTPLLARGRVSGLRPAFGKTAARRQGYGPRQRRRRIRALRAHAVSLPGEWYGQFVDPVFWRLTGARAAPAHRVLVYRRDRPHRVGRLAVRHRQ